jgi:hypothetical protein
MRDRHENLEFEARIAQMAERLAKRNVAIEKEQYAAKAFVSWQIVAGTGQKKFYFSYDGKDSYLMYRNAAIAPKTITTFSTNGCARGTVKTRWHMLRRF